MKKIRKILLPIASVIGMTSCIAPMAACNTTATTTVAKTTAAKTSSDVTFTEMPETIRALYDADHNNEAIAYDETHPWEQQSPYGWDKPKFENNKLYFRNSGKSKDTRFISEMVRVDVTIPANTTRTNEISIRENVTTAANGHFAFSPQCVDICSEIFTLKNTNDHPNHFLNSFGTQIATDLYSQCFLEASRRVGGLHGFNWFHTSKYSWVEWHANCEFPDRKIAFTDTNTTNEPMVFSHYLMVTANTFRKNTIEVDGDRECGYTFTFSANEIN